MCKSVETLQIKQDILASTYIERLQQSIFTKDTSVTWVKILMFLNVAALKIYKFKGKLLSVRRFIHEYLLLKQFWGGWIQPEFNLECQRTWIEKTMMFTLQSKWNERPVTQHRGSSISRHMILLKSDSDRRDVSVQEV